MIYFKNFIYLIFIFAPNFSNFVYNSSASYLLIPCFINTGDFSTSSLDSFKPNFKRVLISLIIFNFDLASNPSNSISKDVFSIFSSSY